MFCGVILSRGSCMILLRMRRDRSVQPSCTRSSSAMPKPAWLAVKFSSQRCCQPGVAISREPFRIDRHVGAHVHRRRRALKHQQLPAGAREMRHALHRGCAGADDRDAFVGELVHRRTGRIAAGVGVVPAAGVERMSFERFDAGNAGQLGHVQRSRAHADELRGERIAAIRADAPARMLAFPRQSPVTSVWNSALS